MNHTSSPYVSVFEKIRTSLLTRIVAGITLLSFPFSGGSFVFWTAAESDPQASQYYEVQFDELYSGLEFAIDQLDRSRFDLEALSSSLSDDPVELANWVASHIAYVPYEGLLKGAQGTVMAGQGNDLDRTVLLARLLINKQFVVRVVGAPVNGDLQSTFASKIMASGHESWVQGISKEMEPDLDGWAEISGKSKADILKDLHTAKERKNTFVKSVADTSGSFADSLSGKMKLKGSQNTSDLSKHYWVEYHEKGSENWKSVSTVFADVLPESLVASKAESYDRIAEMPAAMKHHVLIRFVVDQTKDGVTSPQTALEYTTEAWKLATKQIDFGFNGRHSLEGESAIEQVTTDPLGFAVGFRESVLNESEWVPFVQVEDEGANMDKKFDTKGELSNASESMGEGNAKALGNAMSIFGSKGLGGDTKSESVSELTGVRIEFEFTSPGAAMEKETREIFYASEADFEGQKLSESARNRRAEALGRQFNGLILVGKLCPEWNDFIQLDTFLQTRLLAKYLFRVGDDDPQKLGESLAKMNKRLSQRETSLHALAASRMVEKETYLGSPNLLCVSVHNKFSTDGSDQISVIKGFDWIKNRVCVNVEDSLKAAKISLLNGVRDTVLETSIQQKIGQSMLPNAATVSSSESDFADEWIAVDKLDGYANAEVERAIQSDIAAGYEVFASKNSQGLQWWRIDPLTGETLGFAYAGDRVAGAAMTEYQIQLTLIAINTIKCLGGYYACARDKKGLGCYLCHWVGAAAAILSLGLSTGAGYILSGIDGVSGSFCNVFG